MMRLPFISTGNRLRCIMMFLGGAMFASQTAWSQETSLFRQTPPAMMAPSAPYSGPNGAVAGTVPDYGGARPAVAGYGDVNLAGASWTYSPPPPQRSFRIQDIVTIRVDELARMRADGAAETRKNTLYDAILRDWVSFRGGRLTTGQEPNGDPRVNVQSNQLYRADAAIESRESLTFSVAARVVDIQPNGNLVLEANKTIWMNDNSWETSLSGICRAQDIAPDNVILSRDLLDLQIRKKEKGQLRDGYKRGWLTRWIDEFNPF